MMDSEVLHNIKNTPFNERETFNNAILLLSMVKSEFYYIVGFSRPDNIIEIGFDFENEQYDKCTEVITMEFSNTPGEIKVFSQLSNVAFEKETAIPFVCEDAFNINNGYIQYGACFEKDEIIPVSMEKLNSIILSTKKQIRNFLEKSFDYYLESK